MKLMEEDCKCQYDKVLDHEALHYRLYTDFRKNHYVSKSNMTMDVLQNHFKEHVILNLKPNLSIGDTTPL